jgi:hypothetical protein
MAEQPLVCPNCGHALLGLESQLRKYWSEIQRLRQLFVEQGRLTSLVAHQDGELFHWAVCKWAEHIPSASRVEFATREDALDAGFQACKVCNS